MVLFSSVSAAVPTPRVIPPHDLTLKRLSCDEFSKLLGRLFPATIGFAVPLTSLPSLGGVDAVEPNRDSADLDRVPVHDVGFAG
jgi:hypothetical protein